MLANLALNPILLFGCQIVTLLVVNLCFSSISQCAVDFHWRTINYPEGSIEIGVALSTSLPVDK